MTSSGLSIGAEAATEPSFLAQIEQEFIPTPKARRGNVSMSDLYDMSPVPLAGSPPVRSTGYHVSKLWDRHKEILRQLVQGKRVEDIATDMDVDPVSVQSLRNSPLGKAYIARLTQKADDVVMETAERISRLAPRALKVLTGIMSDEDNGASIRAKVAMDMLDRAGLAAVKKMETKSISAHLSAEDIAELKDRARNAGVLHTPDIITTLVAEVVCENT